MTIEEIYVAYKCNWVEAMRDLYLSPGTYKHWKKIGFIPPATQKIIEERSKGRFKAHDFKDKPETNLED